MVMEFSLHFLSSERERDMRGMKKFIQNFCEIRKNWFVQWKLNLIVVFTYSIFTIL